MDSNLTDTYTNFPAFRQALQDLQAGNWQEGLTGLAEVEKAYPLDTDLRALRQEMQVRARVDDYEIEEIKADKKRRLHLLLTRGGLVALTILLMITAVFVYSDWLGQQWNSAQQAFNSQVHQTELAVQFLNANQLLKAGQTDQALQILRQISEAEPHYIGLDEVMSSALAQQELESQYNQAMEMLASGNSQDALTILQMIDEQSPQYRDVALQIASLQTQAQLDAILVEADLALSEERWGDAIAGYESLRLLAPGYNPGQVESHLFDAYINAATSVLEDPQPSLGVLRTADNYFSQALALRPQDREAIAARTAVRTTIEESLVAEYILAAQNALMENPDSLEALTIAENYFAMAMEIRPNDPNIQVQFQLSRIYLDAMDSYSFLDYSEVIDGLEYVVGLDENYANGTARQTLYEAYIGRGQAEMSVGNYAFAINDFQRAALLAQQDEDAVSTYFEAQILIAEAEGLAGNYFQAVQIYQTALFESEVRQSIFDGGTRLSIDLQTAEAAANSGNYQNAYILYRNILRDRYTAYDNTIVIRVKNGDYFTSLARQFNTTVAAILAANGLTNQDSLDPNSELIIPTLP
ncbi:MAG TPA: LysM peptidoglycan-binding domain-containing protein [Anaerolineales bacterium]|nr:LysM peptidoglycan-binding domain-containing protein [Anaerolineales bacterium]